HRIRGARSRTHEGSGIGLALVQELVRLHGGAVRVESEPGRGTTFTVTVPLGKAHLPADRIGIPRLLGSTATDSRPFLAEAERWLPDGIEADVAPAPDAGMAAPEVRILLADDNADMRDYLRRLLSQYWTVEVVPDGRTALAAARRQPPDLVLTDVMMPGRDGFELRRGLGADAPTRVVPVILLPARAGEEAQVEGLAAGADDYLIKPFSARELIARVNTHLTLARERRQAEAALREREG